MQQRITTKAQLLEHIARGPAVVQQVYSTAMYRVSVPLDADPNAGVWISLSADGRFIVEDYAQVRARVGGSELRLTQREATEIARLIARTMRLRARPWHSPRTKPTRGRLVAPRLDA